MIRLLRPLPDHRHSEAVLPFKPIQPYNAGQSRPKPFLTDFGEPGKNPTPPIPGSFDPVRVISRITISTLPKLIPVLGIK